MFNKLSSCGVLLALLPLGACQGKPQTGPATVRWDKVSCARCIMAVSDHHYSAQVRGGSAERKTKVYYFDDIGCAVLWLEKQEWRLDPRTEMWVTDYQSGEWIDARQAFYATGQITPMDYGLGAEPKQQTGSLNYEQAVQEIHDRENRLH